MRRGTLPCTALVFVLASCAHGPDGPGPAQPGARRAAPMELPDFCRAPMTYVDEVSCQFLELTDSLWPGRAAAMAAGQTRRLSIEVHLFIDREGRIERWTFQRQSGDPGLDEAVVRAVGQLSPRPPPAHLREQLRSGGLLVGNIYCPQGTIQLVQPEPSPNW